MAPIAGWFSGPVFSRAKDIFAANMTELLDRAEDPARMIRMIILEMEETLVEVRATAATLDRRYQGDAAFARPARGDPGELDRQGRAGAVEGPRGPRQGRAARAPEGRRHGRGPQRPRSRSSRTFAAYEADIAKLQGKLREARARQNAIPIGSTSAVTRAKAREMLNGSRTEDAFSKFEILERRADFAEGAPKRWA
jgi:phage shock protein A